MSELKHVTLNPPASYMEDVRYDVGQNSIKEMLKNADSIKEELHHGFRVRNGIDGKRNPNREVALVTIGADVEYEEHIHENSDALFVITDGQACVMSEEELYPVCKGDVIAVPRGAAHGFAIEKGGSLSFVSIQSPPILDHHTGKADIISAQERNGASKSAT